MQHALKPGQPEGDLDNPSISQRLFATGLNRALPLSGRKSIAPAKTVLPKP